MTSNDTHPDWCAGTEEAGEPHRSAKISASGPHDAVGIRLWIIQHDPTAHSPGTTGAAIQLTDGDEWSHSFPLDVGQLPALADACQRLRQHLPSNETPVSAPSAAAATAALAGPSPAPGRR